MARASATRSVEAPAAEVWARIGGFHRLHEWHPAIADVQPGPEPALRNVTMANGHELTERLVDEGPLSYTYAMERDNPGMRNYRSTIGVREDGPSACVVDWTGEFEVVEGSEADLVAATSGFYQMGLDNI